MAARTSARQYTRPSYPHTVIPEGGITTEHLVRWVVLIAFTTLLVIGLMKGMLALAVYLIKTLPMQWVT